MTTRQSQHAALMRRRAARESELSTPKAQRFAAKAELARKVAQRLGAHHERLDRWEQLYIDAYLRPFDFPPFPVLRSYLCDTLCLSYR